MDNDRPIELNRDLAAVSVNEEGTIAPIDIRTAALVALALVVVLIAMHLGEAFFIPLLVSVFLSYALSPVVSRMERWRVPRWLGAATAMLLLVAVLGIAVERTISGATDVLEELPRAVQRLRVLVTSWDYHGHGPLKQVRKTADELQKLAGAASASEPELATIAAAPRSAIPTSASDRAPATAPAAASTRTPAPVAVTVPAAPDTKSLFAMGTVGMTIFISQMVSVLFLTYFLLSAGDLFRRKLMQTLGPSLTRRKKALQIMQDVHEVSQRYFALVLAINALVGLVTGLGLYLLGVRHPVFWGAAIAVLHTIPYLGAAAVTGAVAMTAYLQFESLGMALAAAAVPLAAAAAIGILLQTKLMGRAVRMNAVVVFVALLFWGMVWGAWGLLLAFPIMASIKIIFGEIERLKPIALLMSD